MELKEWNEYLEELNRIENYTLSCPEKREDFDAKILNYTFLKKLIKKAKKDPETTQLILKELKSSPKLILILILSMSNRTQESKKYFLQFLLDIIYDEEEKKYDKKYYDDYLLSLRAVWLSWGKRWGIDLNKKEK